MPNHANMSSNAARRYTAGFRAAATSSAFGSERSTGSTAINMAISARPATPSNSAERATNLPQGASLNDIRQLLPGFSDVAVAQHRSEPRRSHETRSRQSQEHGPGNTPASKDSRG